MSVFNQKSSSLFVRKPLSVQAPDASRWELCLPSSTEALQVIQSSSEAPAACSTHSFRRPTTLLFLSNTKSPWRGRYGERRREKKIVTERKWQNERERGSERWHGVTSVIALAVETHKPNPCSPLFTATLPLVLSLSSVPSLSLRAWICYYAHKSLMYCLWITSLPVNKGYFHKKPPFHFSFNLITS